MKTLVKITLGVLAFVQLVLLLPVLAVCWVILGACNLVGWVQGVIKKNSHED